MVANKNSAVHNIKGKRLVEKKPVAKSQVVVKEGETITLDRRENRNRRLAVDRRAQNVAVENDQRVMERRVKVSRRRQIDPTTCEREYTIAEIEFMSAMDAYKRRSGRMFPTCSEVLEVVKALGYEKRLATEPVALPMVDVVVGASAIPAIV